MENGDQLPLSIYKYMSGCKIRHYLKDIERYSTISNDTVYGNNAKKLPQSQPSEFVI
ncbi:MAG: hypothetical protein ACI8RD_003506 [Bacillariaceae sp.]|jgi:hypothetical protein